MAMMMMMPTSFPLFPIVSSKSPHGATVSAKTQVCFFPSCLLANSSSVSHNNKRTNATRIELSDFSKFCKQFERTLSQRDGKRFCNPRAGNPQTMRYGDPDHPYLISKSLTGGGGRMAVVPCGRYLRSRTPVSASQGPPNLWKMVKARCALQQDYLGKPKAQARTTSQYRRLFPSPTE